MTSTRDGSVDYHPTHPLTTAIAAIDEARSAAGRASRSGPDDPTAPRPRRRPGRAPSARPVRRRRAPRTLTVVYDETCELCRRAREWLATQPSHVQIELLAAGSSEAKRRYGELPWLGRELVVVDEAGNTWIGPAAFLVAIWSTRRYRRWAFRLSEPAFAPMAERFFHLISAQRRRIGAMVGSPACTYCNRTGTHAQPDDPSHASTPLGKEK
ncbi:MAG: DUF393 domain-containing protein [Actinobacteria bacterium]|nr:DUF393 domain-containing protein [Actinomycetota bacterium]